MLAIMEEVILFALGAVSFPLCPLDADPLLWVGGLGIASWALMFGGKCFPTRPWCPAVGPTKLVSPFSLPSVSSFSSRLLLLGMVVFLLSTLAWLRLWFDY